MLDEEELAIEGIRYTWVNGTVENRSPHVAVCGVGFDSKVRIASSSSFSFQSMCDETKCVHVFMSFYNHTINQSLYCYTYISGRAALGGCRDD